MYDGKNYWPYLVVLFFLSNNCCFYQSVYSTGFFLFFLSFFRSFFRSFVHLYWFDHSFLILPNELNWFIASCVVYCSLVLFGTTTRETTDRHTEKYLFRTTAAAPFCFSHQSHIFQSNGPKFVAIYLFILVVDDDDDDDDDDGNEKS